MGLHNLSRILDQYEQQFEGSTNIQQFDSLKGLPFYNWPVTNDSQSNVMLHYQQPTTDFNHAIGLPRKNGMACPLHDYEQLLYDTLQSNKHIWIKKATGLGVTEFMLRYMAWLCFNEYILNPAPRCAS